MCSRAAVGILILFSLVATGCGAPTTQFEPPARQSSLLLPSVAPVGPTLKPAAVLLEVPANPAASKWYEDADRGKWYLDSSKWYADQD